MKSGRKGNIFVNAASCKIGGAKTVVQKYLDEIPNDERINVTLIAPDVYYVPDGVRHIVFSSSGIVTLFFSIFVVPFLCAFYGCKVSISFSNISPILWPRKRFTYFHQLKAIVDSSIKYKIFRFVYRFFGKADIYIFQTEYVCDLFREKILSDIHYELCWPGVSRSSYSPEKIQNERVRILVPYTTTKAYNKNFSLVEKSLDELHAKGIEFEVVVTSHDRMSNDLFKFVGYQSADSMIDLYSNCDIVLVCSLLETVCLPIFEFALTGKPCVVLSAPYVKGVFSQFECPENIHVVKEREIVKKLESLLGTRVFPGGGGMELQFEKSGWSDFWLNRLSASCN